jgi:D-glycero-D-manno-heptose 1,7-bisphosphate phosphatase
MGSKGLFLDRDGVVNLDTGYVYRREDFKFIDGYFDFVKLACDLGYKVFIVTNQSGIARGLYSEKDFLRLSGWIKRKTLLNGGKIQDVYYCPHHPDEGKGDYKVACECRKPKSGMILQAAKDHDIELRASLLIGDKSTDIEAGRSAGLKVNILFGASKVGAGNGEGLQSHVAPGFQECQRVLRSLQH